MLRRLGGLQRRIGERQVDAFLRSGVALDFHADCRCRYIEEGGTDADRQPRRTAGAVGAPGRPQQIGDERQRGRRDRTSQRDRNEVAAAGSARTPGDLLGRREECHERATQKASAESVFEYATRRGFFCSIPTGWNLPTPCPRSGSASAINL